MMELSQSFTPTFSLLRGERETDLGFHPLAPC